MTARIILSLTLLLMLGGNAATQAAQEERVEKQEIQKSHGGYSVTMTTHFDVSPEGYLEMEDLIGDVYVEGAGSKKVEIIEEFFFDVDTEKEAESAFERYRARITKSGNRIAVIGNDEERRRYVSTTYRVKVPEKYNVEVETMGGDVSFRKVTGEIVLETLGGDVDVQEVAGQLEVETAGGDVTVINVTGEADLETAGGDVDLDSAHGGPFRLKTAGGDITLRSIEGAVDAETSGGDVEARHVKGDLDLGTSGGDITMEDVQGQTHSARTSGGDVEAEKVIGEVTLKTSGGDVNAIGIQGDVYGRTSGGDIEILDISGDVDVSTSGGSLDLQGVMGKLYGKTSGGDIEARVQGQGMLKAPVRLSTSGGEITLELPGSVKASVEAKIRTSDPFSDYTIRSDFDLKIVEEEIERGYHIITATGELNGGGPLIELETVEGDINIEKH